jgi:hypothetical protein
VNVHAARGGAGLLVLLVGVASCSGSGSAVDTNCEAAPPLVEPPAGTPAARADVEAILATSCALGGCHLGMTAAAELSLPLTSGDWVSKVVGRASRENPSMSLVSPGDTTKSWMMQKIVGAPCRFADQCTPTLGCGEQMPLGAQLPAHDVAVVAAWIDAGAMR